MRKSERLGNVYMKDITIDLEMEYKDYNGWQNKGTIKYKIGRFGKTKKVEYIVLKNHRYKIAFVESRFMNYEIPDKREDRENLLLMAYSKVGEMQYFLDLKKDFLQQEQERQERERKQKELEEKRRIELGEQITFEKYLLNITILDSNSIN